MTAKKFPHRILLQVASCLGPLLLMPAFAAETASQDKEDIQNSIIGYKAAIGNNPNIAVNHLMLGRAFLLSQDFKGAKNEFETTIKLSPKDPEPHEGLSRALLRLGDREGAMSQLREAIALNAKAPDYHYRLALLVARTGSVEEAIKEFQLAAALDPQNAAIHRDLGAAY